MLRRTILHGCVLTFLRFAMRTTTSYHNSQVKLGHMLRTLLLFIAFTQPVAQAARTKLSVGFVYLTTTSDLGWTWRHNQGRVFMHTQLAAKYPNLEVHTFYEQSVDDTLRPPNCPPIWDKWGKDGIDIVFGTSFGHQFCMVDMVWPLKSPPSICPITVP